MNDDRGKTYGERLTYYLGRIERGEHDRGPADYTIRDPRALAGEYGSLCNTYGSGTEVPGSHTMTQDPDLAHWNGKTTENQIAEDAKWRETGAEPLSAVLARSFQGTDTNQTATITRDDTTFRLRVKIEQNSRGINQEFTAEVEGNKLIADMESDLENALMACQNQARAMVAMMKELDTE